MKKQLFGALALLSMSSAYAAAPTSITMVPYQAYNEAPSAYNFGLQSQDEKVTNNRWDILYQSDNTFSANMVVDEVGLILDLGAISCADIPNQYEGQAGYITKADRTNNPMEWLEYSQAFSDLQSGKAKGSAPIQQGHCYLVYKTYTEGRDVAVFHVADYQQGKSVTIDQIQVFDHSQFKQN